MELFSCSGENSTQTELHTHTHTHTHTHRSVVSMNKNVRGGFRHSWIQVLYGSPESGLFLAFFFQVLFSSGLASFSNRFTPHNVKMAASSLRLTYFSPS